MQLIHSTLKFRVLSLLKDIPIHASLKKESAVEGADFIFSHLKNALNSDIFRLYLNNCEKDFFEKNKYHSLETFVKGFMEARYFILRKFEISFSEYFKTASNVDEAIFMDNPDTDIKYA